MSSTLQSLVQCRINFAQEFDPTVDPTSPVSVGYSCASQVSLCYRMISVPCKNLSSVPVGKAGLRITSAQFGSQAQTGLRMCA